MADILAALLIWSEDTKNHFKLKVGDIFFSPLLGEVLERQSFDADSSRYVDTFP
jgi:hypothetical protein